MALGEIVEIEHGICSVCKGRLNHTMGSDAISPIPSPGDFSICLHCGGINVFGDDLLVRAPTDGELTEAMEDNDFQEALKAAEQVVRDRGQYIGTA